MTFATAIIFAGYVFYKRETEIQTFFPRCFLHPEYPFCRAVISAIFSANSRDPSTGLLNSFLNLFAESGVDNPIFWLGSQKLVIYSIIIAMVWQAIGYYMVNAHQVWQIFLTVFMNQPAWKVQEELNSFSPLHFLCLD